MTSETMGVKLEMSLISMFVLLERRPEVSVNRKRTQRRLLVLVQDYWLSKVLREGKLITFDCCRIGFLLL